MVDGLVANSIHPSGACPDNFFFFSILFAYRMAGYCNSQACIIRFYLTDNYLCSFRTKWYKPASRWLQIECRIFPVGVR
ncbi:hypothetical protein VTI28DRAFT_1639 [Corynascus sepedonium]